jgi:parallel beta-helix repeat protein
MKNICKKTIVISIILLFIIVGIHPAKCNILSKEISCINPNYSGSILYVDDNYDESTPGWNVTHFNKIQKGINAANDGDTIFVYSGNYYERPRIQKQLFLKGREANGGNYPLIIGGRDNDVVIILADGCLFEYFWVKNGPGGYSNDGITLKSDNNIIQHCRSFETGTGLVLSSSNNNTISNNVMTKGWNGMKISGSNNYIFDNSVQGHTEHEIQVGGHHNYFYNNIVGKCGTGHGFNIYSDNCTFSGNTIFSNHRNGIQLGNSRNNIIMENEISNNKYYGLSTVSTSINNHIYRNNFIDNWKNAFDGGNNTWNDWRYGNYWSDYIDRYPDAEKHLLRPWMWDTPYEISGDNIDKCPLVKRWPDPRPKTIIENMIPYNSLLLRLLEIFSILKEVSLIEVLYIIYLI